MKVVRGVDETQVDVLKDKDVVAGTAVTVAGLGSGANELSGGRD